MNTREGLPDHGRANQRSPRLVVALTVRGFLVHTLRVLHTGTAKRKPLERKISVQPPRVVLLRTELHQDRRSNEKWCLVKWCRNGCHP